jgi:hypothetical protein
MRQKKQMAIARGSSTAPDQPQEVRKSEISQEELRGLDEEEQRWGYI